MAFGSANVSAEQTTEISQVEQEKLLRDYRDAYVVRDIVHQHSDLLEELSDDGVLDNPRIDDLEELTEPSGGVGERLTTYNLGKGHTPEIKVFRRVESGYLSLLLFPEKGTARALFNPVEDGEQLGEDHIVKYGSMPDMEVEPEACLSPWQCYGCHGCSTYCCKFNGEGTICEEMCEECYCSCSSTWC
ncbi:hypothetical protein [Haladaptatus cibarius]|uniref:hypothetical protein n=1 Tax=Haladaptatus cibarius TaxID=453847 RepID=UPI000A7B6BDC|nr:hypothetical protein [Haladaptatus cibarius]